MLTSGRWIFVLILLSFGCGAKIRNSGEIPTREPSHNASLDSQTSPKTPESFTERPVGEAVARQLVFRHCRARGLVMREDVRFYKEGKEGGQNHSAIDVVLDGLDSEGIIGFEYIDPIDRTTDFSLREISALKNSYPQILLLEPGTEEAIEANIVSFLDGIR